MIDTDDLDSMSRRDLVELLEAYNESLAEVKRLQNLVVKGSEDYTTSYTDLRKIIEDVHWALTGNDVHYSQSDGARITYALGILSEVIG